MEKGIPRRDIRVAVHDYKIREYHHDQLVVQPDYYCRSHRISDPEQDNWIHYLSHELVGLSDSEIEDNYSDDPEVVALLKNLNKNK